MRVAKRTELEAALRHALIMQQMPLYKRQPAITVREAEQPLTLLLYTLYKERMLEQLAGRRTVMQMSPIIM